MKNLDKALENLKFDKRMTGWNMNNDVLTQSELDSHVKGLEDLSANADVVTLEGTDDDSLEPEAAPATEQNQNPQTF